MNKFEISIKQDGEYQPIQATPVFPFSWGELLDERLDEAYITLYDSPEKTYKRLTDVKVTITNGSRVKDEYFIIASDNSYELPVGSGKYKHDIYLIERTKLLEGIYCSTITFTNSKGTYTNAAGYAVPIDLSESESNTLTSKVPDGFVPSFKSVVPIGNITLPSAQELATEMLPLVQSTTSDAYEVSDGAVFNAGMVVTYYTSAKLITSNSTSDYGYTTPISFKASGAFVIQYTLCYKYTAPLQTIYKAYIMQFDLAAVKNRFPLKRWTISDCITRACELAEPLFAGETPKYRLDGVVYENGKATYTAGSLAEKYNKVFAPEFTATEDTLREQLKLILSYVHAEPWLDENDVIKVTEYGSTTKSAAASLPYVYSAVSSHINEYCTEVRSHAQNLVSSLGYARGVITDPGNGLYRSLRSETAYVRINENNGVATTTFPIYTIEKVMCGIAETNGTGWRLDPVDITQFVFEDTEYSANLDTYAKKYAIYYTQGSPNLKGLFYKAPNAANAAKFSPFSISNILSSATGQAASSIDDLLVKSVGGAASLVFSISYKPISNHFVSHGKQLYVAGETPYMQLYNQSENLVESQYYGENLRGVAARLGNIEKERTFILKNINDVPRVGEILDGYAISAVSCELYPFDIKCTVGLTKDFNRISEYVGINSQKRMYEISERAAADRTLLIKETLVIGTKPSGYRGSDRIWGDLEPFRTVLSNIPNTAYKISTATFTSKTPNNTPLSVVALPVIGRALGNVLTLNFGMKDNYSAGAKTIPINGAEDVSGRWESDVPYSDYYGRVWFADVWFQRGKINSSDANLSKAAYDLPNISGTEITAFGAGAIKIANHLLRKDNRERISYNVELDIKTSREDIIVGTALADLCGWVNDTDVNPVIYYFDAATYNVSKFDKIYTPHSTDIEGGSFDSSAPETSPWNVVKNSDGSLTLTVKPKGGVRGWVICTPITTRDEQVEDENGNPETVRYTEGGEILLASNTPIEDPISLDFYVVKN
jgi:hypothetical protein